MCSAIQQPVDAARGSVYGEIGAIPGKMFETFMRMSNAASAPNPHAVAAAIVTLVETEKGARPERVVAGQAFGAGSINAQAALTGKIGNLNPNWPLDMLAGMNIDGVAAQLQTG